MTVISCWPPANRCPPGGLSAHLGFDHRECSPALSRRPIDSKVSYLFRKVLVVHTEATVGPNDMAKLAAKMLRGHGCFSIDLVLEEAFQWCSSLEESCKIYYYTRNLQAVEALISQQDSGNLEYRKHTDDCKTLVGN